MVPKLDELISAYVLLVLGWNIMKNTDFDNFGRFDPISGHFGPVCPSGPILPIFKIEHFAAVFSMILSWKLWKNVIFIISRLFLDDSGPNAPIGPTAPKWLFSKLSASPHFFVILGWKIYRKICFLPSLDDFLMILDQIAQLARRRRNGFIRNRALLCSFFCDFRLKNMKKMIFIKLDDFWML